MGSIVMDVSHLQLTCLQDKQLAPPDADGRLTITQLTKAGGGFNYHVPVQ